MKSVVLNAVVAAVLIGTSAPALAGESYYLLSVDILAADGTVALHKQVKCPRYEKCTNGFPYELNGKKQTLYVNTRVPDDHHLYMVINPDKSHIMEPGGVYQLPFDDAVATKAFEPGNEWTVDLTRQFKVPKDPAKRKFKWDTIDWQRRTVLKVHMKLDG